ncbi:excinuclease ABC subunit A [Lutimaribacter saemankumensis]|uniref:Nickel/cobalt transporter regulator n=1 Tax=Lutimaribacter saemankumensis TaxID=490829 RepID=A0A1G8GRH8_9RHOB|nr:excinuclease ABC subunit A [Lutimaribacter saemankumensis]SDH96933.1 hypothetical protein SAMN05421850_101192 [Lutimaribacter saemankumensis]
MTRLTYLAASVAVAIAAGLPADAAGPKACPPGLAKKSPACIPPGQVGKAYRVGDRITGDYVVIRNAGRWGLDPNETYYRIGDQVLRVDRDTKMVLDLIGAAAAILN